MQGRSPLDVIKPEVRRLSAYTLKHVAAEVKLDQNENPYELPQAIKDEVMRRVSARSWGRYPEFVPGSIIRALSKFANWPEAGILTGNGSNELILSGLSVILGPGKSVAIPEPTFTLYKLLSSVYQANVVTVPLRPADFSYDVDALIRAAATADVTVICSPNNPTGSLLDLKDLKRILEATNGIVFLDEAYHEFSRQTAAVLLPEHRNLVVLRTFSKAMSMAGLRFGYLMADPEIAREIHKAKLPYNVNIVTLTAIELILAQPDVMLEAINQLIAERARVLGELQRRPGLEVFESHANFLLIRTPMDARTLFDGLYAQGVLVRDVSGYPMLSRSLRVSIGRPEENDRFLQALDRAID
jgi:histidinol-phosphate aminotransferase